MITAAYTQQYAYKQFTVSNGFPRCEVYSIHQSKDGYLIFTTDRGIIRYNGYNFRNYALQDGLPGITVFGGCKDINKNLYFFTYDGDIFSFDNGHIITISVRELKEKLAAPQLIQDLLVAKDKSIWIVVNGYRRGFFVIDSLSVLQKNVIPYENSTIQIKYAGEGKYLCAYNENADRALLHLREQTIDITDIMVKEGIRASEISTIVEKNGFLYLAFTHGLLSVNLATKDHIYRFYKEGLDKDIFIDSRNDLWIGNARKGILRFYNSDLTRSPERLLDGETVTAFLEDHEGGKWFSTLDNGIFYMPWEDMYYYHDVKGMCRSITVYHKQVVAGFAGGKVVKYSEAYQPEVMSLPFHEKRQGEVQSFCENKGHLYAMCSNSVYDITTSNIAGPEYTGTYIRKLRSDGNNMWGLGNGFYLYDEDSVTYSSKLQSKFDEWSTDMVKLNDSLYLVGTFSGVYTFNKTDIRPYHREKGPLFSQRVSDLEVAGTKKIFATTGNGLFIETDHDILHIGEGEEGLLSNICNKIVVENDSTIWLATNKGINTLKLITSTDGSLDYEISKITLQDGLNSDEVYDIAVVDNNVWACTDQGLVKFCKDMYNYDSYSIPVILNYFKAGGEVRRISDLVKLSSDQNFIEVSYEALFFKNPSRIRYRYRVNPDQKWSYTRNTYLKLLDLAEKKYRLQLQASVDNVHWFGVENTVSFVIEPPLWRSLPFKVVYLIIGTVLLSSIFYYQFSVFKRKTRLEKRAFEAEQRALRAQVDPHFIFNSLNSINAFIMSNDKLLASQYLTKFSRLMRQMLENSNQSMISISKEIDVLKLYMAMEALRVENKFEFKVTHDAQLEVTKTCIPTMLIQPFVENAIWHGVMPLTARKGCIQVHFSQTSDGGVLCIIDDNGVGRKDITSATNAKMPHHSYGISLIRNRLAVLSAINDADCHLQIIDKTDDDGCAAGTRIELLLPANKNR